MKKVFIIVTLFSLLTGCSGDFSNKLTNSGDFQSKKNTSGSYFNKEHNLSNPDNPRSSSNFDTSNSPNEENLKELQKKGLEIIENQSFWVDLEKWGKTRFISTRFQDNGLFKVGFCLADNNEKILYRFSEFYGNGWGTFYELRAVSFKDANKDGLKDVIIIAEHMTGAGPQGAIPFPVCSIYFQKENEFINLPALDEEINFAQKNEGIDMVLKFMEGKVVKFDK